MPSPFPGMDPYFEHPALWHSFHSRLIADIQDTLAPLVRPRYYVEIEERVYLADSREFTAIPDVGVVGHREPGGPNGAVRQPAAEHTPNGSGARVLVATVPAPVPVKEWYLELRGVKTDDVVTVIEVLSPTNKARGLGREEYEKKRFEVLATRTSLVEIDLLRAGERMPASLPDWPPDQPVPGDYRVLVARGRNRPWADVYTITLRDPLPTIPVPLRPEDDDAPVDLQRIVHRIYDRLGYGDRFDYARPPVPPLREEDATWSNALLRERGLR